MQLRIERGKALANRIAFLVKASHRQPGGESEGDETERDLPGDTRREQDINKSDYKNENALKWVATWHYDRDKISVEASGYYNYIFNYVLSSSGGAQGTEQAIVSEKGSLTFNITGTAGSPSSFTANKTS